VIATPHLGASTEEAEERCGMEIAKLIISALKEGKAENVVNP
jgi:phosphoglycerate dehydrogenase-like enzyme